MTNAYGVRGISLYLLYHLLNCDAAGSGGNFGQRCARDMMDCSIGVKIKM